MMLDKRKLVSRWVFITGILVIVLGIVHISFTSAVYHSGFHNLWKQDRMLFLFLYLAAGVALMFAGFAIAYCSRGLRTSEGWAQIITAGAGLFVATLGIGAIFFMPQNPFSYVTTVLSIAVLAPLVIFRNRIVIIMDR